MLLAHRATTGNVGAAGKCIDCRHVGVQIWIPIPGSMAWPFGVRPRSEQMFSPEQSSSLQGSSANSINCVIICDGHQWKFWNEVTKTMVEARSVTLPFRNAKHSIHRITSCCMCPSRLLHHTIPKHYTRFTLRHALDCLIVPSSQVTRTWHCQ